MPEEEPVGYLGGEVDPYASNDSSYVPVEDPYASDEGLAGYLDGSAGEEDLPALPGESQSSEYSARDFIDSDPALDSYDPYASDSYASGEYGYEDYDPSVSEGDASYFDSMGHEDSNEQSYSDSYSAEYDDPDQPKTISQQDAESIIRRITTKRIMPPETEQRRPALQPSLTPTGGGLRVWPLVAVLLIAMAFGVGIFRNQIGEKLYDMGYTDMADLLGYVPPPKVEIEPAQHTPTPEELRKKRLEDMVKKSELKAFGIKEKDLGGTNTPKPATNGGGQ